jgi:type I restriction enzyme S subunit
MPETAHDIPDGFRLTELGPLPLEWEVKPLGEVAQLRFGRTPARKEPRFWSAGAVPWVSIGDLNDGTIRTTKERISEEAFASVFRARLTPAGTLLLSFKLTVGKTGILGIDATHNEAIASVAPDTSKVERDFLFLLLRTLNYRALADPCIRGRALSRRKLMTLSVPLPPLDEQRAIVRVLSAIQRAIEASDRVIAAARELKRSLMRHLFSYGPVPTAAAEHRPLKETELGPVPAHWGVASVSSECQVKAPSVTLLRLSSIDTGLQSDVLVHGIKVADMNLPGNEREITKALLQVRIPVTLARNRMIPPRAIVFPCRGAAIATNKKRLTTTWTALDPNLIAVVCGLKVSPEFLFNWFQTFDLTSVQNPGPTPQLNKKDIEPIRFPLPPSMTEQEEVAAHLLGVDHKTETEERGRAALKELFRTMLHLIMTGKLRAKGL